MPMIDVYATEGTFADPGSLAQQLATTLMRIEQVPELPMFRNNTAAFIHALPDGFDQQRRGRRRLRARAGAHELREPSTATSSWPS